MLQREAMWKPEKRLEKRTGGIRKNPFVPDKIYASTKVTNAKI